MDHFWTNHTKYIYDAINQTGILYTELGTDYF